MLPTLVILVLVDQQLPELPVAAAEFSAAPFVCHSVDVLVLIALADDHVVLLFQVFEQLVVRVELGVASAARQLYSVIRLFLNPYVLDDLVLVGIHSCR